MTVETLVVNAADLPKLVGRTLGPSNWFTVDQARIDRFAEVTGDRQWIHTDVERAKRDMPGGKTIAHGYLTLSLSPVLTHDLMKIVYSRAINYGSNKVRYTGMVPAGSRVRATQTIKAVDPEKNGGYRLTTEIQVFVEGQERPALVAEVMAIFYP